MITLRGHHLELLYWYMRAKGSEYRLQEKKDAIILTAIEDGHGESHGLNMIDVLEKALEPGMKIRMTDTIDDICRTCSRKGDRVCRELIPYDVSATSADRVELYFYDLKKREYTSSFIQKRILEKGYPW